MSLEWCKSDWATVNLSGQSDEKERIEKHQFLLSFSFKILVTVSRPCPLQFYGAFSIGKCLSINYLITEE